MQSRPPTTRPLSPPSHTPVTTSPQAPCAPGALRAPPAPAIPLGPLNPLLPRDFYDIYWRHVTGLDPRGEIHDLANPYGERYWDTWKRLLRHGKVHLHNTTYTLWINPITDEVFLIRAGYVYDEDTDTFTPPANSTI